MNPLAVNAATKITWQRLDDHGTYALIADDFLVDPHALRAFAQGLAFQPPTAPDNYPGLKSYAALPGAAKLKTWIASQVLARMFPRGMPESFRTDDFDAHGGFSVFACDREHVSPDVEDQHTDGVAWLAAVLHLSTVIDKRGTAMWEHRPTGLQQWLAVDPLRLATIERAFGLRLSAQITRAIERQPGFIGPASVPYLFRQRPGSRRPFTTEEDADWRMTAYVPARWNRLVVYPTWQIHSVVDESSIESPTAETARLTYNLMLEYPFARELTRSRSPYPRAFYRLVPGLAE